MKDLKVRKNFKALAISSSLALLSLTGCGKEGNDCTVREYRDFPKIKVTIKE